MGEIVFSEHSRFQMKERGISENLARKALVSPHQSFIQFDGRTRSVRKFLKHQKPYAVIVISEDTSVRQKVITVFITSKVTKYLQKI